MQLYYIFSKVLFLFLSLFKDYFPILFLNFLQFKQENKFDAMVTKDAFLNLKNL